MANVHVTVPSSTPLPVGSNKTQHSPNHRGIEALSPKNDAIYKDRKELFIKKTISPIGSPLTDNFTMAAAQHGIARIGSLPVEQRAPVRAEKRRSGSSSTETVPHHMIGLFKGTSYQASQFINCLSPSSWPPPSYDASPQGEQQAWNSRAPGYPNQNQNQFSGPYSRALQTESSVPLGYGPGGEDDWLGVVGQLELDSSNANQLDVESASRLRSLSNPQAPQRHSSPLPSPRMRKQRSRSMLEEPDFGPAAFAAGSGGARRGGYRRAAHSGTTSQRFGALTDVDELGVGFDNMKVSQSQMHMRNNNMSNGSYNQGHRGKSNFRGKRDTSSRFRKNSQQRSRMRSRSRSRTRKEDDPSKYELDIAAVLNSEDIRTTLMVKNIPNKYDQEMLLEAINKHHEGAFDFFYLPIDFRNKCNVGYAFINFIDPKSIAAFHEEFNNKKW
eukprot:CAMPEP_0168527326 /NCGR_PEP_ID=MMETSP0405-20121227/12537_1 /TAXON_ID=498012 /ORGANISM="Trichosphaerium sp, Strain Am-I-7 wt" /LENGTH=441 /DNA_ID=CAMNT_0008550419 /DNA_START=104 /DNA_END=1426 /DNA_ORIENTATION=-